MFNLKKKDKGGHLVKEKYYEEFSTYKYAMNLDGVAKICYRDLEAFGLGSLLFREKLNVLTHEPIESDKHYIELFDEDIKSTIDGVEKRVGAVESETAVKKSSDLGGSQEVTIKKSKWNGSFLGSVNELLK